MVLNLLTLGLNGAKKTTLNNKSEKTMTNKKRAVQTILKLGDYFSAVILDKVKIG